MQNCESINPKEHAINYADARLELRHLRYFVTVAERLHFGRAAKDLHISQPPLSRQVRDLEQFLGVSLLVRSAKSVALTDAGAVFLQEARRILSDVSLSVRLAQRAAAGDTGRLSIGVEPLFEPTLLEQIRDHFEERYPDNRLTFLHVDSQEHPSLIRSGVLDAGIALLPLTDADFLNMEPLFRQAVIALVDRSHPLAGRDSASLFELADFPFIELRSQQEPDCCSHAARIGTICGVALPVARTCPALEKLPTLLKSADSIALIPTTTRNWNRDGLHTLRITDPCADFTFGLVCPRTRNSKLVARFLEVARDMNHPEKRFQPIDTAA